MVRESSGSPRGHEGLRSGDPYAEQEEFSRRTLAAAGFPVYGAAGPDRYGEALTAFETSDGELDWVELRCGDGSSPDGPYLTVRTHRPGAEGRGRLPDLEDVVEDERDRVHEQLGIDEGDGPGRVRALREWINVDGEPRAVEVHEDRRDCLLGDGPGPGAGPVWAGRLRLNGVTVTVCGRGMAPGEVELAAVGDFERHIRGRTELLRRLAAQRGRWVPVEERELAPVSGLEAHRAVIAHGIAESAAIEAQVRARRTPRLPRGLRGEAGALRREAAVRQQMRLASETREEAVAAVTAMVGQLTRLSQQTHWLVGTPAGVAAVEESIRWTVFASEVPSLPAQRAWQQLWAAREVQEDWEAQQLGEQLWLSAWEQWRTTR
ncbi:hypothetical protein ACWGB8_22705 [Kitasatospora sp. NPDC054939]